MWRCTHPWWRGGVWLGVWLAPPDPSTSQRHRAGDNPSPARGHNDGLAASCPGQAGRHEPRQRGRDGPGHNCGTETEETGHAISFVVTRGGAARLQCVSHGGSAEPERGTKPVQQCLQRQQVCCERLAAEGGYRPHCALQRDTEGWPRPVREDRHPSGGQGALSLAAPAYGRIDPAGAR
jgi:hypothetical protein